MKVCPKCKQEKTFPKHKNRKDGMGVWCLDCGRDYYNLSKNKVLKQKKNYYDNNKISFTKRNRDNYEKHFKQKMLYSAKSRAKKKNLPFNISYEDINIPEYCPVLGIKLEKNTEYCKFNSPSLDKIIPEKGYIKGNIIVVSLKANQIKNCSSIDELEKVFIFYKNIIRG